MRLEFIIDVGRAGTFALSLLPALAITSDPPGSVDEGRVVSLGASWLIFHINLSFCMSFVDIKDKEGTVTGKLLYPKLLIDSIEVKN